MEIINQYYGEQTTVWASAKNFLRNEPILTEVGEECSVTTLIPAHFEWNLWFHFIHTGAAAKFLVALANGDDMRAAAVVLKGVEWEITSIMRAAAKSVLELFPEATFREQRSILLNLGKGAYKLLGKLNQKDTCDHDDEHLGLKISIDVYIPLLDVEWIEDIMLEILGLNDISAF